MVLPLYAESVAHMMAKSAMPVPCCRSKGIGHHLYINDEAEECNDLDYCSELVYE